MSDHWAAKYIGKRWVSGAQGPDVFDCWGLVTFVQRHEFAREAPTYDLVNPHDVNLVAHAMEKATQNLKWRRIETPVEGCVTAMGHAKRIHHVGVYTAADGGMILHAQDKKGVEATPVRYLKTHGWNRVEYYMHRSWLT